MRRLLSRAAFAGAIVTMCVPWPVAARTVKAGKPLPGIILVTNGPSMLLSWDPKSPLAYQLQPRTRVEVVAAYASAAGMVSGEPVAVATIEPGSTALQFDLATQLRNAPSGQVCLRLRFGRNQSIPLRVPNAGESSDGFRHPRWESSVAAASQIAELERERSRIAGAVSTLEGMGPPFERWRAEKSFADAAACEAIRPEPESARPRAAITGNAQGPAAQYQCVGIFAGFVRRSIGRPGVDARAFAGEMLAALRREKAGTAAGSRNLKALDERLAQADDLLKSIAAHSEAAGPEFSPLLSHHGLSLTSESKRLLGSTGAKPDAISAAAVLDAYGSCLSEARGQFELAYQNWRASVNPALLEKRAELDRRDCRARFASEGDRQREFAAMQARLAEVEDKIRKAGQAPEVPKQAQASLIPNGCSGL